MILINFLPISIISKVLSLSLCSFSYDLNQLPTYLHFRLSSVSLNVLLLMILINFLPTSILFKVLFACPYLLISKLNPEFSNIIFSSLSSSLPFSSFLPFPPPPPTHMIIWKNEGYMTGTFLHFKGFKKISCLLF